MQHLKRRSSFAVTVGVRHLGLDREAVAVLHNAHQRMPHEAQLRGLAFALAEQPRIRLGD